MVEIYLNQKLHFLRFLRKQTNTRDAFTLKGIFGLSLQSARNHCYKQPKKYTLL